MEDTSKGEDIYIRDNIKDIYLSEKQVYLYSSRITLGQRKCTENNKARLIRRNWYEADCKPDI